MCEKQQHYGPLSAFKFTIYNIYVSWVVHPKCWTHLTFLVWTKTKHWSKKDIKQGLTSDLSPSGSFPDELNMLLQEAADRKWPFVEEKWQYKQSVMSEDKTNSSDLVRKHLPQLLVMIGPSLMVNNAAESEI